MVGDGTPPSSHCNPVAFTTLSTFPVKMVVKACDQGESSQICSVLPRKGVNSGHDSENDSANEVDIHSLRRLQVQASLHSPPPRAPRPPLPSLVEERIIVSKPLPKFRGCYTTMLLRS